MRNGLSVSVVLTLITALTGCAATQQPMVMQPEVWQESNEVIGIAVTELPKPDTVLAGSQGLLDIAINTSMASTLTAKVQTWDLNSLNNAPQQVQQVLEQQGYKTKVLGKLDISKFKQRPAEDGYAGFDFRPLKAQEGIDKLVLIVPAAAGTYRTYYGFVPTSEPVAQVAINSSVIDLDDNRLLHYQPIVTQRSAADNWDEAPNFPNLTNAFYQALDMSQQAVLVPFKRSAAKPQP